MTLTMLVMPHQSVWKQMMMEQEKVDAMRIIRIRMIRLTLLWLWSMTMITLWECTISHKWPAAFTDFDVSHVENAHHTATDVLKHAHTRTHKCNPQSGLSETKSSHPIQVRWGWRKVKNKEHSCAIETSHAGAPKRPGSHNMTECAEQNEKFQRNLDTTVETATPSWLESRWQLRFIFHPLNQDDLRFGFICCLVFTEQPFNDTDDCIL